MGNKVDKLYDEIYGEIAEYHENVKQFLAQMDENESSVTEEEKEKIERMELALQISRDILENIMTPGTTMTIMHKKGSFTIRIDE